MNMTTIGQLYQSGDWKNEKHVPVIESPETVKAGEPFDVTLSIGKEIAHPNTTEHHIRWIRLYFLPDGDKFSYEISSCDFAAHGESTDGANEGPAFTEPFLTARMKLQKSGTLLASSYCNIHGLWEGEQKVGVSG